MSVSAPKRVLLIGGTSEIGLAIVRRLAQDGPVRPFLLGRDRARLGAALEQLERARCNGGTVDELDAAADLQAHREVIARTFEQAGGFDVVVLAVGVLGGQAGLDAERDEALEVMEVDFVGSGSLLLESLRQLRAAGEGTLVVLSSVAAERKRMPPPRPPAAVACQGSGQWQELFGSVTSQCDPSVPMRMKAFNTGQQIQTGSALLSRRSHHSAAL